LEFALGTPRSRDYDITFIQLKIDENGKGEGFMFAGTKLKFDENNKLVLEQIGTSSIRLSSVKLKKYKRMKMQFSTLEFESKC
jgi:hypothetical protein